MKLATVFLIIAFLLLLLLFLSSEFHVSSTIDIHIHDTYIVIEKLSFAMGIFLFLLTFFALGGVIGTRFRSRLFWLVLVLVLGAIAFIIWWFPNG